MNTKDGGDVGQRQLSALIGKPKQATVRSMLAHDSFRAFADIGARKLLAPIPTSSCVEKYEKGRSRGPALFA